MDPGAGLLLYWWGVVQATFSIPDWKNVVYGWQVFLPATLAAYLLGAIPFGLLLTRLAGIEDIRKTGSGRSEEHTSELQSLMRISYAVFCLNKKKYTTHNIRTKQLTSTMPHYPILEHTD